MEEPPRKPGKINQVTGATAVAPGANQGLDLNRKLLVAGLCLYGSLQCTACMHAGSGRTAAAHMRAGAQQHQKCCAKLQLLDKHLLREGRDYQHSSAQLAGEQHGLTLLAWSPGGSGQPFEMPLA